MVVLEFNLRVINLKDLLRQIRLFVRLFILLRTELSQTEGIHFKNSNKLYCPFLNKTLDHTSQI